MYSVFLAKILVELLADSLGSEEVVKGLAIIYSVHGLFMINSVCHPGTQPLPRKVDGEDEDPTAADSRGDASSNNEEGGARMKTRALSDKFAGANCESKDLWWLGIFNAGEGTYRRVSHGSRTQGWNRLSRSHN